MFGINELEKWTDMPLLMETNGEITDGHIVYGVYLSAGSRETPITRLSCNVIDYCGERAKYWFVNGKKKFVLISLLSMDNKDSVRGIGYNNRFFRYKITRK